MRNTILFYIILAPLALLAQDYDISSKVIDSQKKPVSFANVILLKAKDSSFVKGVVSENDGSCKFSQLDADHYLIKVSFVGYSDFYSEPINLKNSVTLSPFVLEDSPEFLDEVTITAKRPIIQNKVDRMIFEVENTVVSSGTTYDILKRTPGVLINQDVILVRNRPAQVYINDRKVYLTSQELQRLLEGFAGVNVKSVEVITTPPAKYDAEGGAIININTSKNLSIGYKGSFNASNTVGIVPKYAVGTSQYYKTDWLDAYASYTFNSRFDTKTDEGFVQFYNPDGSEKATWEDLFKRDTRTFSHSLNTILDFTLSEKEVLSFSANVLHTPKADSDISGRTEIYNAQGELDSLYITQSELNTDRDNLLFSLNYKKQLGEKGATLAALINYIDYTDNQTQSVNTRYFSAQNTLLNTNAFNTIPTQNSQIYTGQLDYVGSLGSLSITSGVKYSGINSNSKQEFSIANGSINQDAILNDNFDYNEDIYALYFSFEKEWEKWSFKAGLRGEYTDANGNSRTLGVVNTQEYLELFPTFYILNNPSDNHSFGFDYSRRIDRPRFQSLNPYRYFLNENNFLEGDPNIQPAIGNKVKFSYTYKNKLTFNLYYDHIENAIARLPFQNNQDLTLRGLNTNLNFERQYSLDIIYSEFVTNWMWMSIYSSFFNMKNEFKALEDTSNVQQEIYSMLLQTQNYFILDSSGTFTATVTLDFLSNYLLGSYKYDNPQFAVNFDLQKTFLDGRLALTFSSEDIFNTRNIRTTSQYRNQNNSFLAMPEFQTIRVGVRYKFGNFKLNDNSRSTNATEEDRLIVE